MKELGDQSNGPDRRGVRVLQYPNVYIQTVFLHFLPLIIGIFTFFMVSFIH